MKVLALEFSSPQRSVAVVQGSAGTGHSSLSESVEVGAGAAKTFGLVERVLNEARLEREQIECLAVGLGPGSYTGIRAAIALAQGWQLARGVRLLGISSVECLAAQAQAEGLRNRVRQACGSIRTNSKFTSSRMPTMSSPFRSGKKACSATLRPGWTGITQSREPGNCDGAWITEEPKSNHVSSHGRLDMLISRCGGLRGSASFAPDGMHHEPGFSGRILRWSGVRCRDRDWRNCGS